MVDRVMAPHGPADTMAGHHHAHRASEPDEKLGYTPTE